MRRQTARLEWAIDHALGEAAAVRYPRRVAGAPVFSKRDAARRVRTSWGIIEIHDSRRSPRETIPKWRPRSARGRPCFFFGVGGRGLRSARTQWRRQDDDGADGRGAAASGQGYAEVHGFRTTHATDEVKSRIGLVSAEDGVYPWLTVREMLLFFADLYGVPGPSRRILGDFG